ncbi:MAG: STAS domain-containing protein [Myxococcales bacterium]|nr:STAS domain-containing protein [Myxococcales bacterium]
MPFSKVILSALEDPSLLDEWVDIQIDEATQDNDVELGKLRGQGSHFLSLIREAMMNGAGADIDVPAWSDVCESVRRLAQLRARRGFSPRDNALFVFGLKKPLFARLRKLHGSDADSLFHDVWVVTRLIDELGLLVTEAQHEASENVIARQKRDLMDLSTPVIKLWDGVLALPLVGTMDSHRALLATETLLDAVMKTSSRVVILDITGVPTVDTLVAQHLIKTVKALRLMGADGIISGIGPQIAQTMVQLGVELGTIVTKATLADALQAALSAAGVTFQRGHGD